MTVYIVPAFVLNAASTDDAEVPGSRHTMRTALSVHTSLLTPDVFVQVLEVSVACRAQGSGVLVGVKVGVKVGVLVGVGVGVLVAVFVGVLVGVGVGLMVLHVCPLPELYNQDTSSLVNTRE